MRWRFPVLQGVVGNDTLAVLLKSDTRGDFPSGQSVLCYSAPTHLSQAQPSEPQAQNRPTQARRTWLRSIT